MKNITFIKLCLYIFWIIGIITFFLLLYKIYCLYINEKEYINLFAPFGILISAFIASLSVMRNIENTNQNEISKYYVEKCSEGFEIVYELLKNQNNNRSTWVEAARILKYTLDISSNITNKSYKKIYYIKSFQYRHLLLRLFTDEYGNSLPTSFFFGVENWQVLKVNQAEKIAEDNNSSFGWIEEYEVTPRPKGAYIDESSIKIIFDFISYDDKFQDPLKNEKIDDLEKWKKSGGIFIIKEGAYNYLKFKKDQIKKLKEKYKKTENN